MSFMMKFRYPVDVGLHAERDSANALLLRHGGDLVQYGRPRWTQTMRIVFNSSCSGEDLDISTFIVPVTLFVQTKTTQKLFFDVCTPLQGRSLKHRFCLNKLMFGIL